MSDFLDRLPGGSRAGFAAGAALLTIAIVLVIVLGGSDNHSPGETSTVAARSQPPPPTPAAPPVTSQSDGGKDKARKKTSRQPAKNTDTSSNEDTTTPEPTAAPDPAPSPPAPEAKKGTPVGKTPPDASPATNAEIVNSVIREYLTSISKGDGYQACAQLSEGGLSVMEKKISKAAPETEGARCAQSILLYQGAYGKAIRNPKITKLTVSGSKAGAVGPYREPAELSKHGNVWLIDDYGE